MGPGDILGATVSAVRIGTTAVSVVADVLPIIKGTQRGLRNPELVDQIKNDMLNGNFNYSELRAQIAGYLDDGKYYVTEGHHRMTAALEGDR
ncbi:hypothetical protein BegalDRAFT_1505 [Beggiatoa alba B18LD]|uniref:ParB-like nuclease n=1 Tax=Beggiatoa alba B18LD TaxID=395493 RepID=I3CFJ6_9GAMM|nr:hypothetical protein [Beggiatoa alba]EIJ42389.1 hypothetical protein BegalDRAFT_1505 [Beggiatoa alba B18LD]